MLRKVYNKFPVWLVYTVAFALVVVCSFGVLRFGGQTTIWNVDGIAQHYPILEQFYRILRGTTHQSLFGWSWTLGLGADQMTTFAYYVVGDPFSYLIALFPADRLELGYQLLTILRLYVVGLAFIAFAKQLKLKRGGTLIGTLVYTFGSYSFYSAYHHPFFLLPLIFFPLVCLAIDRIYQGKSFLWLVVITALVLISNVYFAYVLAIGALVFAIMRYLDLKLKGELVRPLPWSLLYFGLTVVMSTLMAAVVLLPNILGMLSSSRSGSAIFASGLKFYPSIYYTHLPNAILNSNGTTYYWLVMGTSGLTFIAMVWTMRHFRRYLMLNVTLLLVAVGLLFPAVAAVMNVMSTPSNRWVLLVHLAFGLAAGLFIDHLHELEPADFKWFMVATAILLALVWVGNGFIFKLPQHHLMTYGLLLGFMIVLAYAIMTGATGLRLKWALLGLVLLNAASTGLGFYSPNYAYASRSELSRGVASHWSKVFFDKADQYLKQTDTSFYRTATTKDYYTLHSAGNNMPMLLGMHQIGSYFSVQNAAVNSFNTQLWNSENTMNNPTRNADERTTMLSLLGVKYLFARQDELNKNRVPYGYQIVRRRDGKAVFRDHPVYSLGNGTGTVLLKNKYALPLAYTQTTQLNASAYRKLSAVDKEQALLSGAQTSQKVSGVKTVTVKQASRTVPYTVSMTSQPITTITQAINYRLHHNTNRSLSYGITGDKTPAEAEKYAATTNLLKPTLSVTKLLAQNAAVIAKNNQKNTNGLKEMTGDLLGQNAQYQLTINNPNSLKNCELYLEIDGIKAQFPSTSERLGYTATRAKLADVPFSHETKLNTLREINTSPYFDSYFLNVQSGTHKTSIDQLGINNMSDYEPKHHLLINLGYSTKARQTINLSFYKANKLTFKHVKVVAVPFGATYRTKTQKLQKQALKHLTVTNNHVTGTTNQSRASVLTTSIPYSKGWQLTVDGQATAIQKVNTGFIGAKIPAGKHHVKLSYTTPGLLAGKWLSILGWFVLCLAAGWTLWRSLIKRRRPNTGQHAQPIVESETNNEE